MGVRAHVLAGLMHLRVHYQTGSARHISLRAAHIRVIAVLLVDAARVLACAHAQYPRQLLCAWRHRRLTEQDP